MHGAARDGLYRGQGHSARLCARIDAGRAVLVAREPLFPEPLYKDGAALEGYGNFYWGCMKPDEKKRGDRTMEDIIAVAYAKQPACGLQLWRVLSCRAGSCKLVIESA